jgi:hypothetical protein
MPVASQSRTVLTDRDFASRDQTTGEGDYLPGMFASLPTGFLLLPKILRKPWLNMRLRNLARVRPAFAGCGHLVRATRLTRLGAVNNCYRVFAEQPVLAAEW